jgi:hypothetical protein
MTKAYEKVQTELLNAYDHAEATRKIAEITVSGTMVKVAPWCGRGAFYVSASYLTLWEACNLLSNRTI